MSSRMSPFCVHCGWVSGQVAGRKCKNPKWHKPWPKCNHLHARNLTENVRRTQGANVEGWVCARLAVEAHKKGVNPGHLAGKLLTDWAEKHGGLT